MFELGLRFAVATVRAVFLFTRHIHFPVERIFAPFNMEMFPKWLRQKESRAARARNAAHRRAAEKREPRK